jgi:hypothetical protein
MNSLKKLWSAVKGRKASISHPLAVGKVGFASFAAVLMYLAVDI